MREEDVSREQGDQNETLLLQAYMYADIFSILRYYHFPCMYVSITPLCPVFYLNEMPLLKVG